MFNRKQIKGEKKEPEEGKKESELAEGVSLFDPRKELKPKEAISMMKEISRKRNFKESVEVIVRLGVDPKQGDQNIRGTCFLPAGTGKEVKVCVFADKEAMDEVLA